MTMMTKKTFVGRSLFKIVEFKPEEVQRRATGKSGKKENLSCLRIFKRLRFLTEKKRE